MLQPANSHYLAKNDVVQLEQSGEGSTLTYLKENFGFLGNLTREGDDDLELGIIHFGMEGEVADVSLGEQHATVQNVDAKLLLVLSHQVGPQISALSVGLDSWSSRNQGRNRPRT